MPIPGDSPPAAGHTLPVLGGGEPAERADAARNRRKILAAAEDLFARDGVGCTSMDAIAEAAGVGKGTLYRRFGDRASLARALIDERDREFQEALIRGAPPLGPGAPPLERIVAFGHAFLGLLESFGDLIRAAEPGGRRFVGRPYALYRTHLRMLLTELDPALDAEYLADALLATLSAELFAYLRTARDMPLDRLATGFEQLVRAIAGREAGAGAGGALAE